MTYYNVILQHVRVVVHKHKVTLNTYTFFLLQNRWGFLWEIILLTVEWKEPFFKQNVFEEFQFCCHPISSHLSSAESSSYTKNPNTFNFILQFRLINCLDALVNKMNNAALTILQKVQSTVVDCFIRWYIYMI